MKKCCESNCKDKIGINKFLTVEQKISETDIPYTTDGNYIMICTPLGNQVKFTKKNKANVVLSGFCTAPDAAIEYLEDENNDEFSECRHSFNTGTMKRGIKKIFESIGIKDPQKTLDIALSCEDYDEMNFLFTQLLCMISKDGNSDAVSVEHILKNSESIRNQANYSITAWYNRINTLLENNGIILLMGIHAEKLIKKTYFTDNGTFKIDYYNKLSNITLLDKVTERYKLFSIIHAAGYRYPSNEKNWLKKKKKMRFEINKLLWNCFKNKMNKLTR